MPLSTTYRAKRALVSLLLKLAVAYDIVLDITRESADDAVLQAFRRAAKKVHPDKGGRKTDFQALQAAKEAWDSTRQKQRPSGNPAWTASQSVVSCAEPGEKDKGFRSSQCLWMASSSPCRPPIQ